ncbi:MAG: DNA-directed RNA polymerase subunit delta [bacterium]|nr:DNA-directed RNA polymerase subunit delta [bacterium]
MERSMLEEAIELMKASSEPQNIYKLIDDVMTSLGLGDDANLKAQLYIDITTCADFVFLGGEDDLWDLKTRQPLEAWDKSFYENDSSSEEFEDDEDNIEVDEYNYVEDEDEEESTYEIDEDADEDEEESTYEIDEDADEDEDDEENSWDEEDEENSWDEDEEEKYNDMMDDYEDLYEDK